MAITAWCVFDDIWCVLHRVKPLTDRYFNFIFWGCHAWIEYSSGTQHSTHRTMTAGRRKASDKSHLSSTYFLTLILSDGNFNTLVPQEQLECIQDCNSTELLGTRYWNSSLQLLSVKWSAFNFPKWSTTLSFQQFCLLCFDLKVSNLKDCCSVIS